jgi:hypothetical protein
VSHGWELLAGVAGGAVVAVVLLDRLVRWSETRGSSTYDDPSYRPGSFNPFVELFFPQLQRQREIVAEKETRGDEDDADGAPPDGGGGRPGPGEQPPRGAGPTAF